MAKYSVGKVLMGDVMCWCCFERYSGVMVWCRKEMPSARKVLISVVLVKLCKIGQCEVMVK